MDLNLSLEDLIAALSNIAPNKIIVDAGDYYDETNQTYKYLYEQIMPDSSDLKNKLTEQLLEYQKLEKEYVKQQDYILSLENELSCLEKSVDEVVNGFQGMLSENVYVYDVAAHGENEASKPINFDTLKNTISDQPAVYQGKRPGWFIALKKELSRQNVESKNIDSTFGFLKNKLMFWKKHANENPETVSYIYDKERHEKIIELLNDKCSNEEKYLKYMLLSPGIERDFLATLDNASQMNLNANLIIALLEQPCDVFNKDIIEMYVSQVRKGTEYNLKQELAEELIAGKWFITAKVNDVTKNFQLVPIEDLKEFSSKFDLIINTLSSFQTPEELRNNSVSGSSNVDKENSPEGNFNDVADIFPQDVKSDNDIIVPVQDNVEMDMINDSIVFHDEDLNSV